jgi:CHAT domain-containing protein
MNVLLADCYSELAEARQARNRYYQAIEIYQSTDNQPLCKNPFLGLANYYKEVHQFDSANTYIKKYWSVLDTIHRSDASNAQEGKGHLAEGSIYRQQKQYNKAITAFNHALFWLNTPPLSNDRGGVFIEIAKTYLEMNQLSEARTAVDTGLKIWLAQASKIKDLIEGYTISGKIHQKSGQFQKAIEEYDKAGQFGSDYGWFLFDPLYQKAQLLTYQNKMEAAYQTYLTIDRIVTRSRFQIKSDSAKLTWAKQTHQAYEKAIAVTAQLHQQQPSDVYLNQIHHFMDKNKAVLLASDWSKGIARTIANVPDSIIEKEKYIYKSLLINQQEHKTIPNQAENAIAIQKITDDLHTFERTLERDYPQYHAAKYTYQTNTSLSISEVQRTLKPEDSTVLITYFYGDSTIYSLGLSAERVIFHQLPVWKVDSGLQRFRKYCETSKLPIERVAFTHLSYDLYENLVNPIVSKLGNTNRLRILRDGLLNELSFEALFTRRCDTLEAKEPLLLQQYSISYLETMHQLQQKSNSNQQEGSDFGAMAFYYKKIDSMSKRVKMDPLDSLPNALHRFQTTVFGKSGHYWSDKFKDTINYRAIFKTQLSQHRIMVFGGHGQANKNNPFESSLVFPPHADRLTQLDIMGLDKGCNQLIIPLACESGVGRIDSVEGMLSLSRGFIQGGYPAVTGSLWCIPEETSTQIIIFFLEHLKKGLPKDKAMQQAKIQYLNGELANQNRSYQYWAGHVVYGNVQPIDFQLYSWKERIWQGFMGMALLGLIFLFLNKKWIKRV